MKRRITKWTIVLALAVCIGHLAMSIFFPWSPLNCRHQDVDITTGRLRFTRYLLFCKVSERIEPSTLSQALPPDVVAAATPEWHRVNTFSPGVHHSPHYIFHSAIYQIHILDDIWKMPEFYDLPEELRKQTALHVLALWQHSGNDSLADDYIRGLNDLMEEDKRQKILSVLPTLTMPRIETNGTEVTRTVFFPNGQSMDRIHGYVDSTGKFVRHGVWEQWRQDGKRSRYGHFEQGYHHGRRFEWDRDGKLIVIEAFNRGQLSEYKSDNLEQHPDFEAAQLLARNGLKPDTQHGTQPR